MDAVKGSSEVFSSLVDDGLLSQDQLNIGVVESNRSGEPLDKTLLQLGFITEALLNNAILSIESPTIKSLSGSLNSRVTSGVAIDAVIPDPDALLLVPVEIARRHTIIPISLNDQVLLVATTDIYNLPVQDRLRSLIGADMQLQLTLAGEREVLEAIDRFYGFELSIDGILHEIETGEIAEESVISQDDYHQPVVRLVDSILTDAVKNNASDIHFEPEAGYVRIRYRVDGVMRQIRSFHIDYWPAVVVRIKVMSELNIAENRAPQDGQLSMRISGGDIEFRVSCMPTVHGENVVLRVLDRQKGIVPLDRLGLQPETLHKLQISMDRPEGLILITGPTGSGKTTTLYSMLSHKSSETINIMTLEDPVEYPMALLRQTSVNEQVKLDFRTGIKSILRQDPDIILVGEIRDGEAAEMVFRASMTGHQVYSTLHANSAAGAIERLKDLGVTPALIGENVIAIVGQRLIRKLCTHCREIDATDIDNDSLKKNCEYYRSVGCEKCGWQGYKGRTAVMEVMRFTPALAELVVSGASITDVIECARHDRFQSLADEALRLVGSGITSMTEASRVIDFTNIKVGDS